MIIFTNKKKKIVKSIQITNIKKVAKILCIKIISNKKLIRIYKHKINTI